MAEFLLELFSEEIPANLQSSARINLLISFKKFFEKENINYKDDAKVFSTPNRLVLCFKKIEREIHQKSEEIKGPNTKAPDNAIEGFLKSNLIQKKDIYKKNTDKGEFFFYKKPSRKIKSEDVLKANIQFFTALHLSDSCTLQIQIINTIHLLIHVYFCLKVRVGVLLLVTEYFYNLLLLPK